MIATSSGFETTSFFSHKMTSMWHGDDMYAKKIQCIISIQNFLTIDSSVSTIGSASHLGSTLDDDVFDNKMVDVQSFDFRITFGVSEIIITN